MFDVKGIPMNRLMLVCAAAAAMAGCNKPYSPDPWVGQQDPVAAPNNNPRIVLSSPDLMMALGFDQPIVLRPDDLLTVAVPLRNLGDERYLLDYRFVWYDKDGLELRPAMGWKEVVIEPKDQRRIQANAIDSRAVEWKVQVRWANR
jgi:uncharacterized protein YcfL